MLHRVKLKGGYTRNNSMPNPNYVCTICSQTFTRKWRGKVHNNNVHAGLAKTVRLIDYMIGRSSGEYKPNDPSLFRRKRRIRDLTGLQATLRDINMREESFKVSDAISVSDPIQQYNEALVKLAELKKLLLEFGSPQEAQNMLSVVSKDCFIKGDNQPLDLALAAARGELARRELRTI